MLKSPTVPPPQPEGMARSLLRNIEAMAERKREESRAATRQQKLAESITAFTGSMLFVYLHLTIYAAWIVINLGLVPGVPAFDKSFVILATEASVEAIFLSTFVLISQNRSNEAASKRADLDLHINLLAEHELTKLAQLVRAIAAKLDVEVPFDAEMDEVTKDVAPEAVLDTLDAEQAGEPGR